MILGKRTLIEERTGLSSSGEAFTGIFDSTYTHYIVELKNVTESSGNIAVRYYTGASTLMSGTNYTQCFNSFRTSIYRQDSGTNQQNRHYDFYWKYRYDGYSIYYNPNISSDKNAIVSGSAGYYAQSLVHGRYNSSIVATGIRIYPDGGAGTKVFTGGTIRIFGIDNS
tara:strand:+ start:764 stop:1267 length:504 start_codon:yes stop_codon:yes gene_type:complete